jgi:hypothetical protein
MPSSTLTLVHSFKEAVHEKVHNLGSDQLKVALCNAANAPTTSSTNLASITPIATTNLSSQNITTASSSQSGGTYKLVLTDLVLTASGGSVAPFRYVVIYNDTAAGDEIIGWLDYGSDQTLADGETMTIDFDGTNGIYQAA